MSPEKFNEIYKKIIQLQQLDIDQDNITKIKPFSSLRIYLTYQVEKTLVKKYYMNNMQENIDRHKICACLLYSIVKVRPFYIPAIKKINYFFCKKRFTKEISYINELAGIKTALALLDRFYQQDEKENVLNPHRHKVCIPDTFSDDYGFIFNMCINLRFSRMNRKLNVLDYSTIFFLLEYGNTFEINNQEQEN